MAGISFLPTISNAQLREKAEELLSTTIGNEPKEPVTSTDTFSLDEQHRQDSIKIQELALQLQEMKLNEILLKDELESTKNSNTTADSLKRAEQQNRIDSLRTLTPGVPVVVEGDTLFYLYAKRGGRTPVDRAEDILNIMVKIGTSHSLKKDSIYIYDSEYVTDIMYGEKVILSITDQDALWQNLSRIALAEQYQPIIQNKIQELREQHSILQIAKRVLLFILVIIIQYFLFKLTNYLFKKLRRKIIWLKQNRLRSITIRDYEFLNTHRQGRVLMFFTNVIRWIVLLIQLTISVPILFAIFPQTEDLALKIFSYLLEPVKMIFKSVGSYIPNLFIILVIYYCIKYIVKGIQYIANEIESENLKISGFYPDWAQPTFNIIRFLLYAFMIAMIYPYLPGSDSGVFQGISVFVGLIISLGSSTVIGNIIAGLVITYMRPFKLGDRIQLNETTGNVIEKTPFVTRLRTPKNEVVTIPNSFIMSSHTTNYSASARQYGLIIHSTVTIGYDVPWRQVHQLLINAARQTTGVLPEPKPFVLETELSDYYPCYQINAYIKDADKLGDIYSDLHQNIQDVFNEAGVEIMSPHYFARRDGSASTIPASPYPDDRVEPSKK
ncbi:mechanosensitive ion channel family protein [Parabacteroides distasonis]|uniref:mechanosensitive ion channel family protein n=1 Tax=Parabacteroides distasonis TaxID=823 RepID=UPI002699D3C6